MPIQNVSTFTDHDSQLESINRQRQLAMMLQNQSLQPIESHSAGQNVAPVSPFQGMAKMLQMYAANKQMERADEQQRELTAGMNQRLVDGLQNYQKTLQGTPEIPAPADELGGGPARPAVPGDRQAAFAQLLASGHPALMQMGAQQIADEPDRQMRMEEFALRREDAKTARETQAQQFATLLADRQQARQDQADLKRELAQSRVSGGGNPYFQFIPTPEGIVTGNARTGQLSLGQLNGRPVMKAESDPTLQGRIAQSKAAGKELGQSGAQAQINLPQAMEQADMTVRQIDDLLAHPGFSSTVGATLMPGARLVEGTPQSDFMKRLDQLKGGAFLQAYDTLKGTGQITEIEGKKATDAITRMDKAQSEKEFINAAREFQGVIRQGVARAKIKAGKPAQAAQPAQPSIDDLLKKYQ